MYLYVTEKAERVVRKSGLGRELEKLRQDAANSQLAARLDEIGGAPGFYKRNYSHFRQLFRVYHDRPLLVLLDIKTRGDSDYDDILYDKSSNAFKKLESLVPSDEELDSWTADQGEEAVPLPNATDEFYGLWLSPVPWDDTTSRDYWVFESRHWVQRADQSDFDVHAQSLSGLIEQELTDSQGQSIAGCGDVRIVRATECGFTYTTCDGGDILLLSVYLGSVPSESEVKDEVVAHWGEDFCSKAKSAEDLRMAAWRAYPVSVLQSMEAWKAVRSDQDTNLALSAEEEALVAAASRPSSASEGLPMFIDGRAGSGKSTMLWHLFARHCDAWMRSSSDIEGRPLYVTYNPVLLKRARDGVDRLLNGHYQYVQRDFSDTDSRRARSCFTTLSSYLLSQLSPDMVTVYSAASHVDYREFVRRFRASFRSQSAAGISPETAWFIIRSLIKGRSDEGYLDPDGYRELARGDQSVSEGDFAAAYDRVWERWYKGLCESEGFWDDQDLARRVLEAGGSGCSEPAGRPAALFCDEAQDFTRLELQVLLRSTAYTCFVLEPFRVMSLPFVFAGDPSQTLNPSGFRWESLTSAFYTDLHLGLGISRGALQTRSETSLHRNYRSVRPLVELTNSIQLVRLYLFGQSGLTPQESWRALDAESPRPLAFCIDKELSHEEVARITEDTIIIVPCEEGAEGEWAGQDAALSLFPHDEGEAPANVMSPSAAKGLEFKQVVLYKFGEEFTTCGFGLEPVDAEGLHLDLAREYFFNKLYVAASRAQTQLYVIDTPDGIESFWNRILDREYLDALSDDEAAGAAGWVYPEASVDAGRRMTGVVDSATRDDVKLLSGEALLPENAETLFVAGREQRNPMLLRQAWRFFVKLGDKTRASLAHAYALYYEQSYEEAGREFAASSEPFRAQDAYWEGQLWRLLSESYSDAPTESGDPRQAAADFMCASASESATTTSLLETVRADLVGDRSVSPLSSQWTAVVAELLERTSRWKRESEEALRLAKVLERLGSDGFDGCRPRAAQLYRICGEPAKAVDNWEACGDTENDAYLETKARLAGYPDALQYISKLRNRSDGSSVAVELWELAAPKPKDASVDWLLVIADTYARNKRSRPKSVELYRAAGRLEWAHEQLLKVIDGEQMKPAEAWAQAVALADDAVSRAEWPLALSLVDAKSVRGLRDRRDADAVRLRFEIARRIARSDQQARTERERREAVSLLGEVQKTRGWERSVDRQTIGLAHERLCRRGHYDEAAQYYREQLKTAQLAGNRRVESWARQRLLVVLYKSQQESRKVSQAEVKQFDELLEAGEASPELIAQMAAEDPRDAKVFQERAELLVTPLEGLFSLPKRELEDGTIQFELAGYEVAANPEHRRVRIIEPAQHTWLLVNLVTATFSGDALDLGVFRQKDDLAFSESDGATVRASKGTAVVKTSAGSVRIEVQDPSR